MRSITKRLERRRAVVIPIDFGLRGKTPPAQSGREPITQARLAAGYDLYLEHIRVTRALREFQIRVETEVAAGSDVEAGDLAFDPDLKIVRRKSARGVAGF